MHLLAISLLAILAGTLLLAKIRKEELGKFFAFVSWFFIVVGFALFIGFIAGGICKMTHGGMPGHPCCRQEMMMNNCHPGMGDGACCSQGMCKDACCSPGMGKDACQMKGNCMKHDSTMKCCAGHIAGDSSRMMNAKPK